MTEARDADLDPVGTAAQDAPASGVRQVDAGAPPVVAGDGEAPAADIFARRRVELGLSLEDVANQLKFSARQIEALEAGDFGRLPGGAFARGMMRSYARLLKLEPGEIGAQLLAAGANPRLAPEEAVSLRPPIPFSEGGRHANLVYMILSLVILAVVAFFAIQWFLESRSGAKLAFVRPVASLVVAGGPAAPLGAADVSAPAASGSAPQAATPADVGVPPSPEARPAGEDDRSAVSAKTLSASAAASNTSAAQPALEADKPPTAATSAGPGKRKILLRFESESWVRIKAARGAILMSQLNPGGTEKLVEGDPPFELTIGNAPRVRLYYNDQPVDLKPYFNVDVARLTLN